MSSLDSFLLFCFEIIFLFLATLRHIELLVQGLDLSHGQDKLQPQHCWILDPLCQSGIKPVSQHSQDATDPLHHIGSSEIILDLQERFIDSLESFCILFPQFLLMLAF